MKQRSLLVRIYLSSCVSFYVLYIVRMSKSWRSQCFRDNYLQEFNFILKSRKGESYAFCSECGTDISISHGGKSGILSHAKITKLASSCKSSELSSKITDFAAKSSESSQIIKAELLFTGFLLEHNVPISAADHVSKLLIAMFPTLQMLRSMLVAEPKQRILLEKSPMKLFRTSFK